MRRIAILTAILVLGAALTATAQQGLLKWPQQDPAQKKPAGPTQPAQPLPKLGPAQPGQPSVPSGQKLVLSDRFRPGDKFISVFYLNLTAKMTYMAGGQRQVKPMVYKLFERYGQLVRTVDAAGAPTTAVRKYFVAYELEEGRKKVPWYVGKTLLLKRQGGRTVVTSTRGAVPPAVQRDLAEELKSDVALSEGPVGPGDRWVLTEATLRRFMDLPAAARGTVRCQWVKNISNKAGHRVAYIQGNMVLTMPLAGGIGMTLDLNGRFYYNLTLGKLEAVIMSGPVTVRGSVAQGGQRVPLSGRGQAKIVLLRRFVK
jgi:hypothetical protein